MQCYRNIELRRFRNAIYFSLTDRGGHYRQHPGLRCHRHRQEPEEAVASLLCLHGHRRFEARNYLTGQKRKFTPLWYDFEKEPIK